MNIGIIVCSRTGHTLSVAERLKKKLSADSHAVTLNRVETACKVPLGAATAELKTKPAIEPYDILVFGCPVQGGVPSPPMTVYPEQVATLEGKRLHV